MTYDVRIERLPLSAVIDLKGPEEAARERAAALALPLPKIANTAATAEELALYWIGPEHWLLRAPLDREEALLAALQLDAVPETLSVVLASDSFAFFQITGPDARQVMAIASPLDTHERAFPENGVTFTEAFGLKALVVRQTQGFELAVEASYADFLEDFLRRAVSL